MPCTLQPWEVEWEHKRQRLAEGKPATVQEELVIVQKMADERTALLCKLCRKLEREKALVYLPKDVAAWWKEHKKVDRKRRKNEAAT